MVDLKKKKLLKYVQKSFIEVVNVSYLYSICSDFFNDSILEGLGSGVFLKKNNNKKKLQVYVIVFSTVQI
jgi:hypothetical protein